MKSPWPDPERVKGLKPGEYVFVASKKKGESTLRYGWCDFCHLDGCLIHPQRHKGKQICLACHKRWVK